MTTAVSRLPEALDEYDPSNFGALGYLRVRGGLSQADSLAFVHSALGLVASFGCPGVAIEKPSNIPEKDAPRILLEALGRLEDVDHGYIADFYDTMRQSTIINRVAASPTVTEAVETLMGLPGDAPLFQAQTACRVDIAGDTAFLLNWHQEAQYTVKDSQLIQLWAPIGVDISDENGALWILPGSHNEGVVQTKDYVPDFGHPQFTVVDEVINRYEPRSIQMNVGEVLLFSSYLIHKSGENRSPLPRLTLITHYHNAAQDSFVRRFKDRAKRKNAYYVKEEPK